MFGDIGHAFRADTLSVADRQVFVTKGHAWKRGGIKPLDNLPVKDLESELKAYGIYLRKKKTKR